MTILPLSIVLAVTVEVDVMDVIVPPPSIVTSVISSVNGSRSEIGIPTGGSPTLRVLTPIPSMFHLREAEGTVQVNVTVSPGQTSPSGEAVRDTAHTAQ